MAHRTSCACTRQRLGAACGHPHHPRRRGRRPPRSAACRTVARGRRGAARYLAAVVAGRPGRHRRAVGAALVAAGTDATGAVVFAGAILGVTSTFATAGLLRGAGDADKVGRGRRLRGIARCLALLLRMLADGVQLLAWLAWTTPFGLTALAAPYADNRVAPLLVLAGLAVGFAAAGTRRGRTS